AAVFDTPRLPYLMGDILAHLSPHPNVFRRGFEPLQQPGAAYEHAPALPGEAQPLLPSRAGQGRQRDVQAEGDGALAVDRVGVDRERGWHSRDSAGRGGYASTLARGGAVADGFPSASVSCGTGHATARSAPAVSS